MSVYRARRFLKGRLITSLWRLRGVSIEDRVAVLGRAPKIAGAGRITLGSRVSFRGFGARSWFHVHEGATIAIGARSFINSGVMIDAASSVMIGERCLIGDAVVIQDSNYHEIDEGAGVKVAPVSIGDNVWIARGAIILPGVAIGDHSVIGAGSVVTRNVPARVVAAGNPARVLRDIAASDRFSRF
jgi:acetyltransferase-like isoleucine patch superfamily enzyme